jgi:hypothetical protein
MWTAPRRISEIRLPRELYDFYHEPKPEILTASRYFPRYVQNSEVKVVRDLISAAEAVADERAFIHLLQMMALDREDEQQKELAIPSSPHSAGANGWENRSIETFLEAAAAWATDHQARGRSI